MSELFTRIGKVDESVFCLLLVDKSIEPWFMRDVLSAAEMYDWLPKPIDISIRAAAILAEKGIAATEYLQKRCEENRGVFTTPARDYRIGTDEEFVSALLQAEEELWKEIGGEKGAGE